jgi:hypothetical protein
MGFWKRLGFERLIHRRGDGLFHVRPDRMVVQGVRVSSDGPVEVVERMRFFLGSLQARLPDGNSDDHAETVPGLGNRKNVLVLVKVDLDGVEAYKRSAGYLDPAYSAGLHPAAVSSSANAGVDGVGRADAVRSLGAYPVVADLAELGDGP